MRRLFAWIAGLVGIAALARWLSTRNARTAPPSAPNQVEDDPADALRRKLSESRVEPPDTTPDDPTETFDERRARIHAKAQEAIDAMQEPPE